MKLDRILVPTDFSPCAEEAIKYAIEFAQSFSAEIHLLHSYPTNPGGISPYVSEIETDIISTYRKNAAERLDKIALKVTAAGIEVMQHLEEEFPSQAIAFVAKKLPADLIIMGTHGTTGLKHVMLGSVAERTIRIAPCPVLTVGEK